MYTANSKVATKGERSKNGMLSKEGKKQNNLKMWKIRQREKKGKFKHTHT